MRMDFTFLLGLVQTLLAEHNCQLHEQVMWQVVLFARGKYLPYAHDKFSLNKKNPFCFKHFPLKEIEAKYAT